MKTENTTAQTPSNVTKMEKPKRPKKTPQYRSQRAVNSVIRSLAVLARRGVSLTEEQKKACAEAIDAAVAETKKTLSAPQGQKAPKFQLK